MTSQPVGAGASNERDAIVYVLKSHINNRPFHEAPIKNAAARDLDAIYAADKLVHYPVERDNYESRQLKDEDRKRTNRAWAEDAIDAIYSGKPIPGKSHQRWEQILTALVAAGPMGQTRPEICRLYRVDGGRVSGALTTLHEAGVIFSLIGVKR